MFTPTLQHLATFLALVGLAHTAPSSLAPRTTTNNVATFDDITETVSGTSIQPIGDYEGVYWRAFRLVTEGIDGTIQGVGLPPLPKDPVPAFGVVPHTPPKVAAFSVVTVTEDGTPSITTIYQGYPATKRVTLHSFWWGAALRTQEAIDSIPLNTQLIITGYNDKEEAVATQNFDFDFTGLNQQMIFANVKSDFTLLRHIDFSITAVAAGVLVSTLIDSVNITVTV